MTLDIHQKSVHYELVVYELVVYELAYYEYEYEYVTVKKYFVHFLIMKIVNMAFPNFTIKVRKELKYVFLSCLSQKSCHMIYILGNILCFIGSLQIKS